MLPEYFYWKLTGVKLHEYTNATTTGLVNASTKEYDPDLIRILGFPKRLFGLLTVPGHRDSLSKDIQRELKIQAEVVLVATHDTASAVEGVDIPKDSLYLSSGTWSLLGVKVDEPILSQKAMEANFTNEGGVGYIRFQKNIMGLWIIQKLREELEIDSFTEMTNLAKQSVFTATFNVNDESFLSPNSMISEIKNALTSGRKVPVISTGDIINSTLHSLALSYSIAIDEIEKATGNSYNSIYVFGGGAKNEYLNRLINSYSKKDVISLPLEATAIGNLKVQEKAIL